MTDTSDALAIARTSDGRLVRRPLSPHLQIYRPQITSVLSIMHRATGVALSVGTLLLAWWLVAAASSDSAYATCLCGLMRSPPMGLLVAVRLDRLSLWYHFWSTASATSAWDGGFGSRTLPDDAPLSGWIAVAGHATVLTLVTAADRPDRPF